MNEEFTTTEEQTLTIQQAIDLGVQHHTAGDLPKAEGIYNQILQAEPNQPVALHLLGVIAHQVGKNDIAVDLITKALNIKSDYAEAQYNLGNIFKELGKPDAAVASYNKALAIKPDYVEAYSNLGLTLQELGKPDAAVVSYNQAIAIKSDYAEARFNLGVSLFASGRSKEAAEQFKRSEFSESKNYLLKCLYELNEQSLFYDQLDSLTSQGVTNPIIGSLSSRSELRYGINRPNPFCNNPFEYVLKTDLTEQCDFKNIFVKTAKNILNGNTTSYKSQGHLTNGQQTAGNVLVQKIDFMDDINRIIKSEIEKYLLAFKDSEEGFIKNWPPNYSLYGWLISMKNGGELRPHMHETWITGSVYINVPPKLNTDRGNLVVCIGDEEHLTGENKNTKKSIDVVTGSLCLFPASLLHYTIPFESEEERIVLAFDVIPK